MDEPLENLDVSQLPAGAIRSLEMPARPLAPWLRFAHALRLEEADRVTRAPLRTLLDFELVLQLDGVSWVWSEQDRGSVDIPAGAIAFIPPGFTHAWGSEVGTTIAVHFDLQAQPQLELPDNIRMLGSTVERAPLAAVPGFRLGIGEGEPALALALVTVPARSDGWRQLLQELVELWNRRAARTLAGALRAAEILSQALRMLAEENREGPRAGQAPAADSRILDLLRILSGPEGAALGARPSVARLAALAHMSEPSFRAAFARATGASPRRYLEEKRMEQAARALVETDRTVTEISHAVGYDDPYHFSRVFRRVNGVSPRGYRRRAQA